MSSSLYLWLTSDIENGLQKRLMGLCQEYWPALCHHSRHNFPSQVWHGGQSFCVSPPNQSTPLSKSTLLISFDLSGPLDTLTRGAYSMSCNAPIFIIQPFRSANYPLPDFCLAWHFHLRTHFLKLFKSNSWVSLQLTQTNLHKEHVWIHTDHLRSYTSLALLLARCIILEKYLISLSQFLCMGIIIMCSPWCCFRD